MAAAGKGKGVYVLPPKKTPSTRPKGIMIGTLAFAMPGGMDLTPPAADIPLVSLRQDEQLTLAVKASTATIREERATRVTSFIYDRPAGTRFMSPYFVFCTIDYLV